jgi:hypothetical protein
MITSNQIIEQIVEALGDDRYSSFVRGTEVLNPGSHLSLDNESYFEWSDRNGYAYYLVLEKIPVEPGCRIVLRVSRDDNNKDFGYSLLNDYPSLAEVLFAYGRLLRDAKERGAEGISYPNDEIWRSLKDE